MTARLINISGEPWVSVTSSQSGIGKGRTQRHNGSDYCPLDAWLSGVRGIDTSGVSMWVTGNWTVRVSPCDGSSVNLDIAEKVLRAVQRNIDHTAKASVITEHYGEWLMISLSQPIPRHKGKH